MPLTQLHLFLTYKCNYQCDHCFVWSGPSQSGVMTIAQVRDICDQAVALGTIEWIYFEGGEPFLYAPILKQGAAEAKERGFKVGIVTNQYWATALEDARLWLEPLVGLVDHLGISTDLFHGDEVMGQQARDAMDAAEQLGIPTAAFVCEVPESMRPEETVGEPIEGGAIAFRGRAAVELAPTQAQTAWETFDHCPHEKLDDPFRFHVDHLGHLHLCQGLSIGSLFERPLTEIMKDYRAGELPVVRTLLGGGPAALVREHGLPHAATYADACHLCYEARDRLRARYPRQLAPAQIYGNRPAADFVVRRRCDADAAWTSALIAERWGTPIIVHGVTHDPDTLPAFVAEKDGQQLVGLITYDIIDRACEIVTLDSTVEGVGVGGALIDAVKELAIERGCERLWLTTTNDNLDAVGFYQRRGFQIVAVHPGAVDRARRQKPQIPRLGNARIPLRDELELQIRL